MSLPRRQSQSISGKDSIPPSLQVLTKQKSTRHRDEYVAEIIGMGFNQHQAELAYEAMEEEHGIKNFSVEQCVDYIVNNFSEMSKVSVTLENNDLEADLEQSFRDETEPLQQQLIVEEEKELVVSDQMITPGGTAGGPVQDEVELEVDAFSPASNARSNALSAATDDTAVFNLNRRYTEEEKRSSIASAQLTPEGNSVPDSSHVLNRTQVAGGAGIDSPSRASQAASKPSSDFSEVHSVSISVSPGPAQSERSSRVESFDGGGPLPSLPPEEKKDDAEDYRLIGEDDDDDSGPKQMCDVCCEDKSVKKFDYPSCGHEYCFDCIRRHYETSIRDGVVDFTCMEPDCERTIDEEEVRRFLPAEYREKLDRFQRNVKLAANPDVRWCTRPGCDTPLFRKGKETKLMCSECLTQVCFDCSATWTDDHECDKLLDEKLEKWCADDGRDVQICPRCNARIEKLEGCNHMKCTVCKYEFCWLCRREYKKGHYDPSNIFYGCPNAERAMARPNKCLACMGLCWSQFMMCLLPVRVMWWNCKDRGFPWCCCCCPCCD